MNRFFILLSATCLTFSVSAKKHQLKYDDNSMDSIVYHSVDSLKSQLLIAGMANNSESVTILDYCIASKGLDDDKNIKMTLTFLAIGLTQGFNGSQTLAVNSDQTKPSENATSIHKTLKNITTLSYPFTISPYGELISSPNLKSVNDQTEFSGKEKKAMIQFMSQEYINQVIAQTLPSYPTDKIKGNETWNSVSKGSINAPYEISIMNQLLENDKQTTSIKVSGTTSEKVNVPIQFGTVTMKFLVDVKESGMRNVDLNSAITQNYHSTSTITGQLNSGDKTHMMDGSPLTYTVKTHLTRVK